MSRTNVPVDIDRAGIDLGGDTAVPRGDGPDWWDVRVGILLHIRDYQPLAVTYPTTTHSRRHCDVLVPQ